MRKVIFKSVVLIVFASVQGPAQTDTERLLLKRIEKLERRIDELEAQLRSNWPAPSPQTHQLDRRLFSGVNQALKEQTLTAEHKFADGFLGRVEYRRDWVQPTILLHRTAGHFQEGTKHRDHRRKEGTW